MVSVTLLTVLRLSSVTYRVTVRGRAKAGFCALMNVPVARLSGESSHFSTHNDLGNKPLSAQNSTRKLQWECLALKVSSRRSELTQLSRQRRWPSPAILCQRRRHETRHGPVRGRFRLGPSMGSMGCSAGPPMAWPMNRWRGVVLRAWRFALDAATAGSLLHATDAPVPGVLPAPAQSAVRAAFVSGVGVGQQSQAPHSAAHSTAGGPQPPPAATPGRPLLPAGSLKREGGGV